MFPIAVEILLELGLGDPGQKVPPSHISHERPAGYVRPGSTVNTQVAVLGSKFKILAATCRP
jgi:hypothetical protein